MSVVYQRHVRSRMIEKHFSKSGPAKYSWIAVAFPTHVPSIIAVCSIPHSPIATPFHLPFQSGNAFQTYLGGGNIQQECVVHPFLTQTKKFYMANRYRPFHVLIYNSLSHSLPPKFCWNRERESGIFQYLRILQSSEYPGYDLGRHENLLHVKAYLKYLPCRNKFNQHEAYYEAYY